MFDVQDVRMSYVKRAKASPWQPVPRHGTNAMMLRFGGAFGVEMGLEGEDWRLGSAWCVLVIVDSMGYRH